MKKNLIFFTIFTLSLMAKSEWSVITASPGNEYITFYNVDWATLKISSNRRTIWLLLNKNGKNIGKVASAKALYEFDCSNDRFHYLAATTFTESYGGGEVVELLSSSEWDYIAPETSFKIVAEKICSRK